MRGGSATVSGMSEFSVIIPTLQRAKELHELVEMCAAHPRVLEVLVINNAPAPLAWDSPKVRVLQQAENIYVNPAWNLGAREARGKYLAIVNDDVLFGDEVFDEVARILRRGWFSMVGPEQSCFGGGPWGRGISHRLATGGNSYMGTFMCLRRRDYVPIPEDMKIWGGDDWLFWSMPRPNAFLIRTPFVTDMSTTTRSPEFQAMWDAERVPFRRHMAALEGSRWWHRLAAAARRARLARHRTMQAARRLLS